MPEITQHQRWLSRKYLAYKLFSNLWFVSAIWLYFYRIFITDQQIGFLDGFAFVIGLLAEVPSGVLADKFGRDKMVKLGQLLSGAGMLIQAFGGGFVPFFVGQAILMIGASFISGADQALFFEKLNFDRSSVHWRKLVTRGSQINLAATLSATLLGGWLYTINPQMPWVLTGIAFIGSALIIWSVKESRPVKKTQAALHELKEHLVSIGDGFKQFITPKLFLYVPVIVIVQGLFYTSGWGLLKLVLLDRFYFSPFWGSVVIAASGLIVVGLLSLMHRRAESLGERGVISTISLVAAASLLVSVADIGMWGCLVIFVIYAGEYMLHPFMSEILNNHAVDNQRATVLSVASFLRTLPYVILAPLIGYLNTKGDLEYFLIIWPILIVAAVMVYLILKKRDGSVQMKAEEITIESRLPEGQ